MVFLALALLASTAIVRATPITQVPKQLPLVIWHGLGDTYSSDGIKSVGELANEVNPRTFVHSIYLDEDPGSDRAAGFIGLLNDQLATVCEQLAAVPELAAGFNAIGFSQGGQFLRGYIERCNSPPVKTLITFGSQHNGIADFVAECKPMDFICKTTLSLLRSSKWDPWVQNRVVPAQYFRDPEDLPSYLEHSHFLADINNERPLRNGTYKANLGSLERFVMIMFEDDETVVPKESAWFAEVNRTSEVVTYLEERQIYKEDWIGLKMLGKKGRLEYVAMPGKHMELSEVGLEILFRTYLGPTGKKDGKQSTEVGGKTDTVVPPHFRQSGRNSVFLGIR